MVLQKYTGTIDNNYTTNNRMDASFLGRTRQNNGTHLIANGKLLDQLRVFNKTLSSSEVTTLCW